MAISSFSRRKDLMSGKLVQKKQFSLSDHYFPAAYDIGQLSLTDIKHLDKIMSVRTENGQICVWVRTAISLPSLSILALSTVKSLTGCIKILVHLCYTIQDSLLFFCYFSSNDPIKPAAYVSPAFSCYNSCPIFNSVMLLYNAIYIATKQGRSLTDLCPVFIRIYHIQKIL